MKQKMNNNLNNSLKTAKEGLSVIKYLFDQLSYINNVNTKIATISIFNKTPEHNYVREKIKNIPSEISKEYKEIICKLIPFIYEEVYGNKMDTYYSLVDIIYYKIEKYVNIMPKGAEITVDAFKGLVRLSEKLLEEKRINELTEKVSKEIKDFIEYSYGIYLYGRYEEIPCALKGTRNIFPKKNVIKILDTHNVLYNSFDIMPKYVSAILHICGIKKYERENFIKRLEGIVNRNEKDFTKYLQGEVYFEPNPKYGSYITIKFFKNGSINMVFENEEYANEFIKKIERLKGKNIDEVSEEVKSSL